MNVKAATEEELAIRRDIIWLEQIAQNQDKRAMQAIYEQYRARLIPFMQRMTNDQGLVEEVYNDVMLTVWKKASQFKGDSKVSSWVFSIAYRACLKLLKKQKVRSVLFEKFSQARIEEASEFDDDRSKSEHPKLEVAIKSLPSKQRIVIELSYFQEYSIEEISRIAECPINTVKTRLHHARLKIRTLMNEVS